jgi:phage gp29-like protein
MVALARRQTKKLLHRIAVAACSLKRAEASGEQTIPDSLMDAVRKLTNKAEEVSMTLTGRELLKPTISLVPELTMTCSEAIDALMKAYAQLAEAELRELITHA